MMSLSGSAWMWSDVQAENLYNKEFNERIKDYRYASSLFES